MSQQKVLCDYCKNEVDSDKIESHYNEHIIDIRDERLLEMMFDLTHKEVYFDLTGWESKGYVKKLEEMTKSIDEIFKKAIEEKIPTEVIFYLLYNYKIAYAKLVAMNKPQTKIAVSKNE